jgi:hypothetical protein
MPRVTGSIPNFLNGVSQQSPPMRLPSQSEAAENVYPTVVDSCTRRPPSEFLAQLPSTFSDSFVHTIIRDDDEQYVLVVDNLGNVVVYDFDGVEKAVTNYSSFQSYFLSGGAAAMKDNLRALTVADTTFLLNTNVTVAVGTAKSPARYSGECLVNILAGNYGKTYRLTVNNSNVAEYTTPDGSSAAHTALIDTSYIAASLVTDLISNGLTTAPWAAGRYGHVIWLLHTTTDFSASVEDGYAGRAAVVVKGNVQKFTDLPLHGPEGIVFKIIGKEGDAAGDYYVKSVRANTDNFSVIWKETVKPDERLGLDASTMPLKLTRNNDGTFTLSTIAWDGRVVGDIEMNPEPSFVGQKIQDIFFHKNRLGLLTEENVVLSESGSFFNFYRTSMMTLLDTDPIDIAVSHVKVSVLHHALPFAGDLLCFSDQTQFALKGNDLLTPKTAFMDPLTELSSTPLIRPSAAGTNVYFVAEREGYANLYEYFLDKAIETGDAEDVAAHAPTYIPAGVTRMASSSDLNLVAMITSGDPDAIYVYKFLWNGQEKIQSAWCRWTMPGASIVDIMFWRNDLVVVCRKEGRIRIEKINCEQGSTEKFYLDSRVTIATGVAGAGITTYTSPYLLPVTFTVVTAAGGDLPAGVEFPATRRSATTFSIENVDADQPVYVGLEYSSEIELSEQFYRDQQRASIQEGRLTIKGMTLNYDRAAYFRVEVTPEGRATRTYDFNGRVIGDPENMTDTVVTDSGRFSFPIMSRSDRVRVRIINDTWLPSSFISAKWSGNFNPNSRQL